MNYINKIQKDNQLYDINDTRITITSDDSGKYLQVQNDGTLAWAEVQGGGGTQLYKHNVLCNCQDLSEDNIVLTIISLTSTQYIEDSDLTDDHNIIEVLNKMEIDGEVNPLVTNGCIFALGSSETEGAFGICVQYFDSMSKEFVAVKADATFISDTVTAL